MLRADQSETCLVDVPRWDFDWQLLYLYGQPVVLEPHDKVEITCVYDTTGRTEPLGPGWGTSSEMCLSTLIIEP